MKSRAAAESGSPDIAVTMPVQTLSQNQPVDVTLRPPKSSVQPHCDASLVEDQTCVDTPSGDGHSSTAADLEVINQDDIQHL